MDFFLCKTRWHEVMRHTVMRPNAACVVAGGYNRAFPSTGGGLGSSPRNFFVDISSEKGILGQL